jgi:hypothetical protein
MFFQSIHVSKMKRKFDEYFIYEYCNTLIDLVTIKLIKLIFIFLKYSLFMCHNFEISICIVPKVFGNLKVINLGH